MYDDIAIFITIVKHKSLAAAAQQLGMPAATMTRRLQKLERALNCQLIHRSSRQFVLTAEGEVYYSAYADLVEQLSMTQRNLSAQVTELSGRLKVLAPTNISTGLLQPMWSGFIQRYPNIQLELSLNNSFEELLLSQADLALRIGPQQDSSFYQKRLGNLATILVASPEYLAAQGTPEKLQDLATHTLIASNIISEWHLKNEKNELHTFHAEFSCITNDISLIRSFVMDGIGIALLPLSEVVPHIKQQRLVRVLPQWQGPQRDLFAVWPSGRLLSAKAKCLRDYMQVYIAEHLPPLTMD